MKKAKTTKTYPHFFVFQIFQKIFFKKIKNELIPTIRYFYNKMSNQKIIYSAIIKGENKLIKNMKITLLCENSISYVGAETCSAEWGLSLLLETSKNTILFDTGHTNIYKNNAKNLGVDLEKIDFLILSHSHWDHVDGLKFWESNIRKKLITHPETMQKLTPEIKKIAEENFEIFSTKDPIEFSNGIFFLGEIPELNDFEKVEDDTEDSAIAIQTPKGAVVISGCSHSGICNICEQAKKVTGQNLYAVIGGFHLFSEENEKIEKTIEYFKKEKIEKLIPMHCMDFPTQVKFYQEFNSPKYGAGDVIEI